MTEQKKNPDFQLEEGLRRLTESQARDAPEITDILQAAKVPSSRAGSFYRLAAAAVVLALGLGFLLHRLDGGEDKYSTFKWPEAEAMASLTGWSPATDVFLESGENPLQSGLGIPPLGDTTLSIYTGTETINLVMTEPENPNSQNEEES